MTMNLGVWRAEDCALVLAVSGMRRGSRGGGALRRRTASGRARRRALTLPGRLLCAQVFGHVAREIQKLSPGLQVCDFRASLPAASLPAA